MPQTVFEIERAYHYRIRSEILSILFSVYGSYENVSSGAIAGLIKDKGGVFCHHSINAQLRYLRESGLINKVESGDRFGLTPAGFDFVLNSGCSIAAKRTATPEQIDWLITEALGPYTVQRSGVIANGKNYFSPELTNVMGQRVVLRIGNPTRAAVFTGDGRFICYAAEAVKKPFNASRKDLSAAMRQAKAVKKSTTRKQS